jgi:hypothetical protein
MNDDSMQGRGALGLFLLALPVVSVLLVGGIYAVATWIGYQGRQADGPLVDMPFVGCPEAAALVQRRAEAMGLPELAATASADGFTLRARLPADPRVAAQIPQTLAAPGLFEIRPITGGVDEATVLATRADLVEVNTFMDFLDTPKVALRLSGEKAEALKMHMSTHMDDSVGYWLDGRKVTTRRNAPPEAHGELRLDLMNASDLDRIEFAAAAGIVLEHGPLPCAPRAAPAIPAP